MRHRELKPDKGCNGGATFCPPAFLRSPDIPGCSKFRGIRQIVAFKFGFAELK